MSKFVAAAAVGVVLSIQGCSESTNVTFTSLGKGYCRTAQDGKGLYEHKFLDADACRAECADRDGCVAYETWGIDGKKDHCELHLKAVTKTSEPPVGFTSECFTRDGSTTDKSVKFSCDVKNICGTATPLTEKIAGKAGCVQWPEMKSANAEVCPNGKDVKCEHILDYWSGSDLNLTEALEDYDGDSCKVSDLWAAHCCEW